VWPNILELVYNNVKSDNASELEKKHENLGLLCNGRSLNFVRTEILSPEYSPEPVFG
jgi:hypothetical protein